MLGAGIIEDVRVQREKGFGFVRYRSHEEAAYAIQAANGRIIGGKSVKVCHMS
jgi:nucleolysin TIA-1/TIAR